MKKKINKGFTLVELIVVISIIAILGSVSIAGYIGFTEKGKQSKADQEAAQIKTALFAGAADPDSGLTISESTLHVERASEEVKTDVELVKVYLTEMKVEIPGNLSEGGETPVEKDGKISVLSYTSADGKVSNILFNI